jgi:hypothetical protein
MSKDIDDNAIHGNDIKNRYVNIVIYESMLDINENSC